MKEFSKKNPAQNSEKHTQKPFRKNLRKKPQKELKPFSQKKKNIQKDAFSEKKKNTHAEIEDEFILAKKSQMKNSLLLFMVLLVIQNKDSYALNILKNLKKADLIVVEGTLYPLLNRLKRENILDYTWKESSNGPPRKYYSLTSYGESLLQSLQRTWQRLSISIQYLEKKPKKTLNTQPKH